MQRKKDSIKTHLHKVKSDIGRLRVEDYLSSVKLWDASHSKNEEIDRFISEMLLMD